jgi:hypothetical protein
MCAIGKKSKELTQLNKPSAIARLDKEQCHFTCFDVFIGDLSTYFMMLGFTPDAVSALYE